MAAPAIAVRKGPLPRLTRRQKREIARRIRNELATRHLADFVRLMWDVLEPSDPLEWDPYIDIICAKLEKISAGEIRRLVVCIPPGMMKSMLVSAFWPAWKWLRKPSDRALCISNTDNIGVRDARRMRQVMLSERYQEMLRQHIDAPAGPYGTPCDWAKPGDELWTIATDQKAKGDFANSVTGQRICLGIDSVATGQRGHGVIIDDPYDAKKAIRGSVEQKARAMAKVVDIFFKTLTSRLNDKRTGYIVLIMQRLHENDLAGVLLRLGWPSVVLPFEYDPDHEFLCPEDPRTERGEVLHPSRNPDWVVEETKADMGRDYPAQYGQDPSPGDGERYKRAWFQTYEGTPGDMYAHCLKKGYVMLSVDCAAKKGEGRSWTVMQAWGVIGPNLYLLGQIRKRMEYPELKATFRTFCKTFRRATKKLVEDASNGIALLAELKHEISGMVAVKPSAHGGKETRSRFLEARYEAMQVWHPSIDYAPWITAYEDEALSFPNGSNDDQVDGASQVAVHTHSGDPKERIKKRHAFLNDR